MRPADRVPLFLLLSTLAALAISGIHPADRFTWWLEICPVLAAVPVLIFTRRRFPLTPLLYGLAALHAVVLMVGGHWTYAEVPAGYWVKNWLALDRNPYDRLGHFMQGFVPALAAREILLRTSPLKRGKWLFFLVLSVCLALSAGYEFFEWGAAVATGTKADAFLGTQGDPWDTQWDMFTALIGALAAQLTLAKFHDRQLEKLAASD